MITKFKLKSHFRRTSHFCYLWIIFSTLLLYLTRNVKLFKAHQEKCIWEPETVLMKRCNVKVFNTEETLMYAQLSFLSVKTVFCENIR